MNMDAADPGHVAFIKKLGNFSVKSALLIDYNDEIAYHITTRNPSTIISLKHLMRHEDFVAIAIHNDEPGFTLFMDTPLKKPEVTKVSTRGRRRLTRASLDRVPSIWIDATMSKESLAAAFSMAEAHLISANLYDPSDPEDRALLARTIERDLKKAGFKLDPNSRGSEDVYIFRHRKDPGLYLKVYTSIAGGQVRAKAADAIRVIMLYDQQRNEDPKTIPIGKMPIIKRSPKSTIEQLAARVMDRARDGYTKMNKIDRCSKCRAPMALSKAKKPYCAETCWLS